MTKVTIDAPIEALEQIMLDGFERFITSNRWQLGKRPFIGETGVTLVFELVERPNSPKRSPISGLLPEAG